MLQPSTPPSDTGDLHVTSVPDGISFELYSGESGTTETTLTGVPALIEPYMSSEPGYSQVIGSVTVQPNTITDLNIVYSLK